MAVVQEIYICIQLWEPVSRGDWLGWGSDTFKNHYRNLPAQGSFSLASQ